MLVVVVVVVVVVAVLVSTFELSVFASDLLSAVPENVHVPPSPSFISSPIEKSVHFVSPILLATEMTVKDAPNDFENFFRFRLFR